MNQSVLDDVNIKTLSRKRIKLIFYEIHSVANILILMVNIYIAYGLHARPTSDFTK